MKQYSPTREDHKYFLSIRKRMRKLGYRRDLAGACLCSSFLVFLYLKSKGSNPKLIIGDGHAYCTLYNTVIDLTATQFGIKNAILITDINKYERDKRVNFAIQNPVIVSKKKSLFSTLKTVEYCPECCPLEIFELKSLNLI